MRYSKLCVRSNLVDMICREAHITRKVRGKESFTKQELLKLHSFLVLVNDIQATPPDRKKQEVRNG